MANEVENIKDRWHVSWEGLLQIEQISEWQNLFSGTFGVKLCFVKSNCRLLVTESKHMCQIIFQFDFPYFSSCFRNFFPWLFWPFVFRAHALKEHCQQQRSMCSPIFSTPMYLLMQLHQWSMDHILWEEAGFEVLGNGTFCSLVCHQASTTTT